MIKNLKKLRQLHGISQQQLADVIMVSQQSVNKYENHDVEPNIETLVKIAEYFNVSVDYLIGKTETKEIGTEYSFSNLSEKEVEIIKEFRKLNEKQKNCVVNLIESYK